MFQDKVTTRTEVLGPQSESMFKLSSSQFSRVYIMLFVPTRWLRRENCEIPAPSKSEITMKCHVEYFPSKHHETFLEEKNIIEVVNSIDSAPIKTKP